MKIITYSFFLFLIFNLYSNSMLLGSEPNPFEGNNLKNETNNNIIFVNFKLSKEAINLIKLGNDYNHRFHGNSKNNSDFDKKNFVSYRKDQYNYFEQFGVDFEGVDGSSIAFDGSDIGVYQTPENIDKIKIIIAVLEYYAKVLKAPKMNDRSAQP